MTNVVIVGAARTPVGAFNGGLSSLSASYLGGVAIEAALQRAKVQPGEVDEVVDLMEALRRSVAQSRKNKNSGAKDESSEAKSETA